MAVPASFNAERSKLGEPRKISARAGKNLFTKIDGYLQKPRKGVLDGGGDGKIGIGDEFQTRERFFVAWAAGYDPAKLHLGERGDLGESAHGKGQHALRICQRRDACRIRSERVIRENLVGDDGDPELLQLDPLVAFEERSGRIIRIDDHDGPCAGCDSAA